MSEDQQPNKVSADDDELTAFEIFAAVVVLTFTVGFALLHWFSVSVSELAKDSFEPFATSALPIPQSITHTVLFGALGLILSASFLMLLHDFLSAKTKTHKATFLIRNIRLLFVFAAAAYVSSSVIGHAFFD